VLIFRMWDLNFGTWISHSGFHMIQEARDFIVSEGHGHPLVIYINSLRPSVTELGSVTEGRPSLAQHSRPPGFPPTGPAVGGVGPGPSQKAGRLSSPLHGWNGHGRSLVPSTGGAGTAVLWFPTRAEHGLEEEHCAAAGERRGGGGQRREEKKRREEKRREILIGADQDQDLFFSVATLSCFQTRSSVSGFLSLALLRKPNREAKA